MTPTANRSVETSQRVRSASGAWYGGVPETVLHRVADPRGDVEVEQLRPGAGEHDVLRLDVAMDERVLLSAMQLVVLRLRELAVSLLLLELVETLGVRMDRDERVEHVERDVDRLPVPEVRLARRCSRRASSPSTYSMIRYHSPSVGLVGPDDLDDVRVVDLAQRADLAADRVVAGGVLEQLERPLLALDDVDALDRPSRSRRCRGPPGPRSGRRSRRRPRSRVPAVAVT